MPMLMWMAAWTSVWGTAVACCNPEWYGPVPPTFPSKDPPFCDWTLPRGDQCTS